MPYCTICGKKSAFLDDNNRCADCRLSAIGVDPLKGECASALSHSDPGYYASEEDGAAGADLPPNRDGDCNEQDEAGSSGEPGDDDYSFLPEAIVIEEPPSRKLGNRIYLVLGALVLLMGFAFNIINQTGRSDIDKWIMRSQYDKVDAYLDRVGNQISGLSQRQANLYYYCLSEAVRYNYQRYGAKAINLINQFPERGVINALCEHGTKDPQKMRDLMAGYRGSETAVVSSIKDALNKHQDSVADSILMYLTTNEWVDIDDLATRSRPFSIYTDSRYPRFKNMINDLEMYEKLSAALAPLQQRISAVNDSLESEIRMYNNAVSFNRGFVQAMVYVEKWVSDWEYQIVTTDAGIMGKALLWGPYNVYGGPALSRGIHFLEVCRPPEPLNYQTVTLQDGSHDYWPVLWTRDTLYAKPFLQSLNDGQRNISAYRKELAQLESELNFTRDRLDKLRSTIEAAAQ